MAWHSLGFITCTAAGTNYRITTNETDATKRVPCFSITFQQIPANTGVFYIFENSTGNATTGVGLLGIVPAPDALTSIPTYTVSIPQSSGSLNAADFYVTSSVAGEKVLASYVEV